LPGTPPVERRAAVRRAIHAARLLPEAMSEQTAAEHTLATLLVESLNIEGLAPADIDPDAALFGDGLGLDSIDALELSLAISKQYGFQLRSDSEENRRIFGSLRALAAHVEQHRTT
jgi:acyl carrier protein